MKIFASFLISKLKKISILIRYFVIVDHLKEIVDRSDDADYLVGSLIPSALSSCSDRREDIFNLDNSLAKEAAYLNKIKLTI